MNAFVKRLLTVLGALFLLVYVGYQGYQVLYSPIRTETVYSQSTDRHSQSPVKRGD